MNSNPLIDTNIRLIHTKRILLVVFSLILVCIGGILPKATEAATLYLTPQTQTIYQGDTFIVAVWVDSEGEDINTVEGHLNFPQAQLEVLDVTEGGSILSVWVKEPCFSNQAGGIEFVGGTPGGFSGQGVVGKIIFHALSEGVAKVNFENESKVLLNDGYGTLANLTIQGAEFEILPETRTIPKNEWEEELEKDNILPEPFEIKISQTPTMFEGEYFIVFSTIDKQTGIDHYEVKEGKKEWKVGTSPYLLEDQDLKREILVKAVDKAGNERIAEIAPPSKVTWKDILPWVILGLIIVGLIVGVIWRIIN